LLGRLRAVVALAWSEVAVDVVLGQRPALRRRRDLGVAGGGSGLAILLKAVEQCRSCTSVTDAVTKVQRDVGGELPAHVTLEPWFSHNTQRNDVPPVVHGGLRSSHEGAVVTKPER
jgi:hypothetical protein